jgi:hypothetical protein
MKQHIDGWVITSNMKPIRYRTWNELNKNEQEDFNHVSDHDKDDPVYFRAYGTVNNISDFMILSDPIGQWIASDPWSMASALFLRVNDDQDVIVGYGYYKG